MCEYLPQSNFKWNTEEWNNNKILSLNDEGETGYLFDVKIYIILMNCMICIMDMH